jgi:hypothetical protein
MLQIDKWHYCVCVCCNNATFRKCAIIRKPAQYLSINCLFLLNYEESKHIYCPETLVTITVSANITHFCELFFCPFSSYPLFESTWHFLKCSISFLNLRKWHHNSWWIFSMFYLIKQGFLLYPPNMALLHPIVRLHKIYHIVENSQVRKILWCTLTGCTVGSKLPPTDF